MAVTSSDGDTVIGPEVSESKPGDDRSGGERVPQSSTGGSASGAISVEVSTLRRIAVLVVILVVLGVGGWFLYDARVDASNAQHQVGQMSRGVADAERAERVAQDYAVGAATMDFNDMAGWMSRLTANTGDDLARRLQAAGSSMEQIVVPLRWTSTSRPLASKTMGSKDGVYRVLSFVTVSTKNTQAPEGIESTATYTVFVDSKADWKIVDVGGVDGPLPGK